MASKKVAAAPSIPEWVDTRTVASACLGERWGGRLARSRRSSRAFGGQVMGVRTSSGAARIWCRRM